MSPIDAQHEQVVHGGERDVQAIRGEGDCLDGAAAGLQALDEAQGGQRGRSTPPAVLHARGPGPREIPRLRARQLATCARGTSIVSAGRRRWT